MLDFGFKFLIISSVVGPALTQYRKCSAPYECMAPITCWKRHQKTLSTIVLLPCGRSTSNTICCPATGSNSEASPYVLPAPTNPTTLQPVDLPNNVRTSRLLPTDSCGRIFYLPSTQKVYNGRNAEPGEVPWIVHISTKVADSEERILCGGTLISDLYVITAAHCLLGTDHNTVQVQLGTVDVRERQKCNSCPKPVRRAGTKVIMHERYGKQGRGKQEPQGGQGEEDDEAGTNDIALVRLDERVKFNDFIQPACLPFDELGQALKKGGSKLITAGWGRTGHGLRPAKKLKMADQNFVSHEDCWAQFKKLKFPENILKILKSQICTRGEKNARALKGDSGGPLLSLEVRDGQVLYVLVGVMSAGPNNWDREDAAPNLYTKVRKFQRWILSHIEP